VTTQLGCDIRPIRNGLYAGDGARIVRAQVRLGDASDVVPDMLRPHLLDVRNRAGARIDYQLDLSRLRDVAPHRCAQLTSAFGHWRAGWMYTVDLGELALLRTLRRWLPAIAARSGLDLTHLSGIDWRDEAIDPETATRLVDQIAQTRRLLAARGEQGWGLYDVTDRAHIRAGISVCGQETLLASPGRAVLAEPGGAICLQYDNQFHQAAAGLSQSRIRVEGWTHTAGGLTVRASETSWTADARTDALLSELAVACPMVRVITLPAVEVFEAVLTGLSAAALHAAHHTSLLRIAATP
jgi:hypothetical protein